MIWVCIVCRKKQELLIKTGTWMHSTAEMSSDPILRRIEQDMAATTPTSSGFKDMKTGSRVSTPQNNQPISPAASISSLFSKAMSLAGTPTNTYPSTRPRPPFGLYPSSSRGGRSIGITRQQSLESSDSGPSPCGYPSTFRAPSRLGMAPPPLTRHRSAEGDDECASIFSGGEATPTASIPFSPSALNQQRFRPRFRGDPSSGPSPRPYLSRGRSFGDPSPTFPSLPPRYGII